MVERGALWREVIKTVRHGHEAPAKQGRRGFRRDFAFHQTWAGRLYSTKRVLAIVAEEPDAIVVLTVYAFYF